MAKKTTDTSPNETEDTKSDTLEDVLEDFNSSWEYCASSWHQRWQDNFALYNNERVNRGYNGITDTFVPMVFSTIETLTSALFGTKPKFNYLAPSSKPDQKTDILNGLLDFYWDKDQWSIKVINWGRSMLQVGTSVVFVYWEMDHPCMINVPIRDFFFDTTANSMENMRFMGRRYLISKDDLKTFEIVDPETGDMKPRYNNLDKIKMGKTNSDNTDKQQKDMWYGSVDSSPEDNEIEVIEYWTKDKVVSVANRSAVIEDTDNWFKAKDKANGSKYPKGIMPFAGLRDYTDESLFLAKGEIDVIGQEQELLNDLTNQNVDSVTYTLNQMYTLDPKYAHMINEIENLPGAVYPVEANSLQPIPQRPVPPDAFNERQNLKNEIRETTASNEVVKGVGQQGAKTTATEINAQVAGAGQRVNLKVTQIENEGFHRLSRIVFDMIKLYVTEPMMVRILGDDGARWEEFDPSEFQGDYEPRVQLDITIENKKQQDAANAKEMLAAFLNDPNINQRELSKLVLRKSFDLDPDEVDTLMTPDPMAGGIDPATGMPIDPMAAMGGMPPQGMPGDPNAMPQDPTQQGLPPELVNDPTVMQDPQTGELVHVPEVANL